jgi:carbonic anhydrase
MRTEKWVLGVLAGALVFAPVAALSQWKTPWSYHGEKGPGHWAELDLDYATCGTGKAQSPIAIDATEKAKLPTLAFDYRSGPANIINNGYTAVRVDYAHGNGNGLGVDGQRYELTQFHFHHPAEEYIHGKQYDMVLHLMHQAANGKAVGVAVLFKAGRPNPTIAKLWARMPQTAGASRLIQDAIDPAALLPQNKAYYVYEGSVSAPPCNENVTWYVLKTPVEISAAQIAKFAKLYPQDVRPVQPLNGRVVRESQ